MEITINEALTRFNVISNINTSGLSKEIKIPLINHRVELGHIQKKFNDDRSEVEKVIIPDNFEELRDEFTKNSNALNDGTEKTEEECVELQNSIDKYREMISSVNVEIGEWLAQKMDEKINIKDFKITPEHFADIEDCHNETTTINGNDISAKELLNLLFTLYVL